MRTGSPLAHCVRRRGCADHDVAAIRGDVVSEHAVPTGSGPEAIRVLLVDDHALFRRGLQATLELEPGITVVGECGDGAEALDRATETLPDVILMDVRMPRHDGIEACSAIKEAVPSAKIIMLTMSDEEADLYEAIKAGASGYLLKDLPADELASSVRAVHTGQSLISPTLASKLLTEFAAMVKRTDAAQSIPTPRLTTREMEVLKLVARGMNNRDIARDLFISENTVKNHVRNILEKLQLHSRMEAVMYAVREKLLDIG
jgi:DNA-binding NarL/FixJ family response regulator